MSLARVLRIWEFCRLQDNQKSEFQTKTQSPEQQISQSIRSHTVIGSLVIILLLGGLGGWLAFASIAGAIIASGTVVVENNIKRVQHREGGIVGSIYVKDGDDIEAGSLLIKLDGTLTRANLAIVSQQMDEFLGRQARLEAQRNLRSKIEFPPYLLARNKAIEVAKIISGETSLFVALRETMATQKAQLTERVAQLYEEIKGLTAQRKSKDKQSEIIDEEIFGLSDLFEKGLVPKARILALKREAAKLDGESGQLISDVARAKGRITETKLQLSQVDQNMRADVAKELREVNIKLAELAERKIAAEDQLKRLEIRAPRSGFVLQLAVHTIGGVIAAGETIMMIVPREDKLTVEVQVIPTDIDQLHVGQAVVLRFPSFNQRTTPELNGSILTIAADLTRDQVTGMQFYVVRINLPKLEVTKLGSKGLRPGMPVEAFVQTGERTALSYLIKPITDQIMRAFREE